MASFQPDTVYIGASWYPEMWPEEEWARDADRMAELGFTLIRVFEFAWKRFEPEEGRFEFDWARRVLDLLHERGIKAMLGTPTAAPPSWLTSTYPEVLGTNKELKQKEHGKRKHYNHHSKLYRSYARKIAGKMADELGNHPAVHSWQIDNEMAGSDFGPETKASFHAWLEEEYESTDKLNQVWGLDFWSQAYDRFDQIPLSTAQIGSIATPERHHPSLMMATTRFNNNAWTSFMAEQVDEIRQRGDWPITTNKTGFLGGMHWIQHYEQMDAVGCSVYADLSYYHYNICRYDLMRGQKPDRPYMLLETAPNWSGGGPIWNIHHDERGVEVMSWMSTLLGGCATVFWQWRSHWAGQEMQHGTHVSQTGKWMPGKEAWMRLASSYKELGGWLMANPPRQPEIGLMISHESNWAFSIDPIHPDNKFEQRFRDDYHLPLCRNHLWRDIIHPGSDLSLYKVLIIGHMPILPEETKSRLKDWVAKGGRLLLGPLVGTRTEEFTTWTDHEFGGLEELMGAESSRRFSPHWVEDEVDIVFDSGVTSHPRIWCEGFAPGPEAKALAHYRNGWGDGEVAVIDHNYGEGRVITVGCPMGEEAWLHCVQILLDDVGVGPVATGGDRVIVVPRADAEGHTVAYGVINYGKKPEHVTLPAGGTCKITGEHCPPELDLPPLSVRLIEI